MGIFDLCAGHGFGEHEDLAVVCIDDSAWGSGFRRDDVHVRVEGYLTPRGHVEGTVIHAALEESSCGEINSFGQNQFTAGKEAGCPKEDVCHFVGRSNRSKVAYIRI